MITVFTPSFSDDENTNAQNLTVKEVVSRLSSERFRVILLCERDPDPRIGARPNTELLRWRKHANTALILAKLCVEVPDIYFFPRQGPLDAGFLRARKYGRLRTALITYVVNGGMEKDKIPRRLAKNLDEADFVVGNSGHVSDLVARRIKRPVATIHDAADRRFFYPPQDVQKSHAPIVLYAGSFRPWKRVPFVVEQAALWPAIEFRIAGMGEDEAECRCLARERSCSNVTFLGHLSPAKLGDEMRKADIFFFPSVLEGNPQVLVQAAACGLPCVAMQCYRSDFVHHGYSGLLARSDDELSAYLKLLITDSDLRQIMSLAAIEHVAQFDWDKITCRWADVFERAVEKRLGLRGRATATRFCKTRETDAASAGLLVPNVPERWPRS